MDLLELLLEKNLISSDEAEKVRTETENSGEYLEDVLDKQNIINSDVVAKEKSEYFNIPFKKIEGDISKEVLEYIPEESARHYRIIPIGISDNVLEIGAINPDRIEVRDVLNFISSKTDMPYKLFTVSNADFQKVLSMYRGLKGEVKEALSELEDEFNIQSGGPEGGDQDEGVTTESYDMEEEKAKIVEDAPVTKIVATILRYATDGDASDVHVEPMPDNTRVRFRVDGELNTSLVLPQKVHNSVAARIKVLSNMKLDEKRKPQDGRFSARIDKRKIDFRVSTFPTYNGEKVVMRILDSSQGVRRLDDIGLRQINVDKLKKAAQKPYGIILMSGPTGSGKTTTLYAMLQEVDREKNNVLSLEDPVEYNMEGISQSQVRSDIGYTFANGLRTILRQDPDIIMVGEIRDKETAQLAIQAALTGHLVFSTIHTNNAIGVIPRLVDMGVDPYLIAPTLVMAIAQRLVRDLCPSAAEEVPTEGSIKEMINKQFEDLPEEFRKEIEIPDKVYQAGSSSECPTGVKGRSAVVEILEMDRELENIILTDPNENKIEEYARSKGMLTLKEDAMLKAFKGEIPFSEVSTL
ncbi:MAG: GspE/PulE family protein [Candidatus Paceibacterota bacterium]